MTVAGEQITRFGFSGVSWKWFGWYSALAWRTLGNYWKLGIVGVWVWLMAIFFLGGYDMMQALY